MLALVDDDESFAIDDDHAAEFVERENQITIAYLAKNIL